MKTTLRALATLAVAAGVLSYTRPAHAQSLNQLGVDRLNKDAQELWSPDGLTLIHDQALIELKKQIGVVQKVNDKLTATLTSVRSIVLDCPGAPGVTKLDGTGVALSVPLKGEWRIEVNVDVHLKGKILGIKTDRTLNVSLELKELRASARVDLDSSDPAAPRLTKLEPPRVHFKLKVKTSSWGLNFLSWLTRGTVNVLGNVVANVALRKLAKEFNANPQGNPVVVGTHGAGPTALPKYDLERAARRIEDEIHATKMPFGTVWEVKYDKPYNGTWQDSIDDPAFSPGNVVGIQSYGDSASFTGHQLAGLSYRFATTGDAATLGRIRQVLASTRKLLTMKGRPGDANRSLYKVSSLFPHQLGKDEYVQSFQGEDWIMSDSISRDVYFGLFFGLSLTYDLVNDAQVRDDIRQQIEMAIDYLLKNHWTWRKRDGSFGDRFQGTVDQQYAWLLAAKRVNPAKYAAVCEDYKGFADLQWLSDWMACLDPISAYYKFELGQGSLFTLLRNETDPVRWQRAYQGMAIYRHYIGHHQNALFNGWYFALDPSAAAALGPENEGLLTHWLKLPRRYLTVDLKNDPTIDKMTFALPFTLGTNVQIMGQGVPKPRLIAKCSAR